MLSMVQSPPRLHARELNQVYADILVVHFVIQLFETVKTFDCVMQMGVIIILT